MFAFFSISQCHHRAIGDRAGSICSRTAEMLNRSPVLQNFSVGFLGNFVLVVRPRTPTQHAHEPIDFDHLISIDRVSQWLCLFQTMAKSRLPDCVALHKKLTKYFCVTKSHNSFLPPPTKAANVINIISSSFRHSSSSLHLRL